MAETMTTVANQNEITPENKKNFLYKYPDFFIFCLVSIGVLAFFFYISSRNNEDVVFIEKHYTNADMIIQNKLNGRSIIDSISLCRNLKTIYFYINDIKQSKMYLATKYERFLIVCYTIGIFFIVLTAVVAFVITKKGWDSSSRIRKGLLLTCVFYGILLPLFPKLFDQDQNYKNNFADYTALSKSQLFIYSRLNPYFGKSNNKLSRKDSIILFNTMDTVTSVLMEHLNIDISIDTKQLDVKTIDFK